MSNGIYWAPALLAFLASGAVVGQHANHGAAAPPAEAAHTEHAGHEAAAHAGHGAGTPPAAPVTDEMRATAFPDLGAMNMTDMMILDPLNKLVLLDRLERGDADGNPQSWKLDAWIGRDLTKLWIRSEGERARSHTEKADLEVLWGKSFTRWWDFVAGARRDFEPGPEQDWAAVGVRGLAPYRFDVEATAYVGENGATALRFESHYEILVTNRLILEPQIELNWYGQTNRARGIGSGLSTAELGLRLRYEFRREVAPYIGIVRERLFGATAELAPGDRDDTRLVAGLHLWF